MMIENGTFETIDSSPMGQWVKMNGGSLLSIRFMQLKVKEKGMSRSNALNNQKYIYKT